ncbi:hypothetical protein KY362_02520 [Candidatus Woesearchaeota archaeon]|nr:hypothetical protein [Candidatus Woesearchaeota archaeon]
MLISIYSCRGWKEPASAKADITGEKRIVSEVVNRIVDLLPREIYYASYAGSYNGESMVFVRESLDVIIHEAWHRYVDEKGLSTGAGLAIEEASALVIDEYCTRNPVYERHIRSSSEFVKLYRKVMARPDSPAMRDEILRAAAQHGYQRDITDPRISPWAYLTDDLKYMLLYGICLDVTRKGIEFAREVYLEALGAVKEDGIQEGLDVLRSYASSAVSDEFDFDIYPFEEEMPKLFSTRNVEIYGNDAEAVSIMRRAQALFQELRCEPGHASQEATAEESPG